MLRIPNDILELVNLYFPSRQVINIMLIVALIRLTQSTHVDLFATFLVVRILCQRSEMQTLSDEKDVTIPLLLPMSHGMRTSSDGHLSDIVFMHFSKDPVNATTGHNVFQDIGIN